MGLNGQPSSSSGGKGKLNFPILQAGSDPFSCMAYVFNACFVRDLLNEFQDIASKKIVKAEDIKAGSCFNSSFHADHVSLAGEACWIQHGAFEYEPWLCIRNMYAS